MRQQGARQALGGSKQHLSKKAGQEVPRSNEGARVRALIQWKPKRRGEISLPLLLGVGAALGLFVFGLAWVETSSGSGEDRMDHNCHLFSKPLGSVSDQAFGDQEGKPRSQEASGWMEPSKKKERF